MQSQIIGQNIVGIQIVFNPAIANYVRIKVVKKIADLEKAKDIQVRYLALSIQYRTLDKKNWGQ